MTNTYYSKNILTIFWVLFPMIIYAQNYCDFVEKVQSYQKTIKLKTSPTLITIDTTTFNLNQYLSFFSKLKCPKKTKCNYFYLDAYWAGMPCLYLSDDYFSLEKYLNQKVPSRFYRSKEREDFLKSKVLSWFIEDSSRMARFNMIPEDSEEGYFQYLFFYKMGEQFALWSHSNYSQKRILCSQDLLDPVMKECSTKGVFKKGVDMKSIDLSPKLILEKDYCYITWIEVETHKGIFRRTYKISRNFPFMVINTQDTKLLELIRTITY